MSRFTLQPTEAEAPLSLNLLQGHDEGVLAQGRLC